MNLLFVQYPKCSTCRNAAKWLKENNIESESKHIVDNNPTAEELNSWLDCSGTDVKKLFNTSGKVYRENNLKDVVKTASRDELINLLASNGMLVKRPLLVGDDFVMVGFKEDEWKDKLIK